MHSIKMEHGPIDLKSNLDLITCAECKFRPGVWLHYSALLLFQMQKSAFGARRKVRRFGYLGGWQPTDDLFHFF